MKQGDTDKGLIKAIVSDGRQASFESFELAEKWLDEYAPGLYACTWRVETVGKEFREYNTDAPI